MADRLFCKIVCFVAFIFNFATTLAQPKVGDVFPAWTEGHLDIHHINTGKGECAFLIFPDGTTMLVDAGASERTSRVTPAKPDSSRTPGKWITRYIQFMMRDFSEKKLNYIWVTHFHSDHTGSVTRDAKKHSQGGFVLSGITEVGSNIPFDKIVDRDWPEYRWPVPLRDQNYINFVKWKTDHGVIAEQFRVGANDQFKLVHYPALYSNFEIRNIASNGNVWTGFGNHTRNHFPSLESISKDEIPGENQCSSAIRLSYGQFDYFNGGDITTNVTYPGHWLDIESPVGLVTGPVEVCVANHHAASDAMGEPFLRAVRPRVHIIQVWVPSQPNGSTLNRMQSKRIYPGERDIFATNVMEETKAVVGNSLARLKSQQGHIVIRVNPGGNDYMIYILDDSAETFKIKTIHGAYNCN